LGIVVLDEFGRHPWTVVDMAMSRLRCSECGGELSIRYPSYGECGRAFVSSIAAECRVRRSWRRMSGIDHRGSKKVSQILDIPVEENGLDELTHSAK